MSSTQESPTTPGAAPPRQDLRPKPRCSRRSASFSTVSPLSTKGILRAFGIPRHLLHISLDAVFVLAAYLRGRAFLVYGIVNVIAMLWPKHPVVQIKIIRVGLPLLLLLGPARVRIHASRYDSFLVALLVLFLFEFAWPILVFRDKASLPERSLRTRPRKTQSRPDALRRVQIAAVRSRTALVLGGYLALFLARSAGKAEATRTKDFFFLEDEPGWLIVAGLSDRLVAAGFDATTATIEPRVLVRAISPAGIKLVRKSVVPCSSMSSPKEEL